MFLPSNVLDSVSRGGYYSLLLVPGVRIVVINTVDGDLLNFYMLLSTNEFDEQHSWIISVLEYSRTHNEKVILVGHMPTRGAHHSYPIFTKWLSSVITDYSDVIQWSTFAHIHSDKFSIIPNISNPKVVQYSIPPITPYSGSYPSAYHDVICMMCRLSDLHCQQC